MLHTRKALFKSELFQTVTVAYRRKRFGNHCSTTNCFQTEKYVVLRFKASCRAKLYVWLSHSSLFPNPSPWRQEVLVTTDNSVSWTSSRDLQVGAGFLQLPSGNVTHQIIQWSTTGVSNLNRTQARRTNKISGEPHIILRKRQNKEICPCHERV
jgi:hypothetical protein